MHKRNFLLSQCYTKMPCLRGPLPVFSGMTSGVRLIRNQSWILEHQTQMDLFRKIQSRPKRTAPKYKFDLLRVHQPPQFCDLTAATGPVNFDISGTGQSLQAGADIGFRKLDPFFFQPAAQERTSAAGIGSNKGQDPVFRYI